MSNPPEPRAQYKIVFEFNCNWADSYWEYKIYRAPDFLETVYSGSALSRWGAERIAKRKLKKIKKGKLPKKTTPNIIWID